MEKTFQEMYYRLAAAVVGEEALLAKGQAVAKATPEGAGNLYQVKLGILGARVEGVRKNLLQALADTEEMLLDSTEDYEEAPQ